MATESNIRWFEELGMRDVPLVGGKTASLGELYASLSPKGLNVPNGFGIIAIHVLFFGSNIRNGIFTVCT